MRVSMIWMSASLFRDINGQFCNYLRMCHCFLRWMRRRATLIGVSVLENFSDIETMIYYWCMSLVDLLLLLDEMSKPC